MAAPSYGNDLTLITTAESLTGWTAVGGGGAGLSASPDLAVQGTNCVDKQITNTNKGMLFDNGAGISPGSNDHIYAWIIGSTPGLEATLANEGKVVAIGTTSAAYVAFHVSGSNVSVPGFRTETCFVVRYVNTTSAVEPYRTLYGSPGTNPQWFGGKLSTTATVKGANLGVDVIRYGTGYYITAGEDGNAATFAGTAADNDNTSNQYGILQEIPGGYALQGRFVVGQNTSGTPTFAQFEDSNVAVTFTDTPHSLTDFTQVIIDQSTTIFLLTDASFTALGTNNPGEFRVNDAATCTLTRVAFNNIGVTVNAEVNTIFDSCSWIGCDTITTGGADFSGSSFSGYTGSATGDAQMSWNTSADTNGRLDDCTFTQGTVDRHALEWTTSAPTATTLTDVTWTDYSGTGNDAAIYVRDRGSDTVFTFNWSGGTAPTVRKERAGDTINIVNSVAVDVQVTDTSAVAIEGAAVFMEANGGAMANDLAITTLTRSGTTATATTGSAHGLTDGQQVAIRNASDTLYNRIKTVAVTSTTQFTYTVSSSAAASATGADVTGVILNGITGALGRVERTDFPFASDQPVRGYVKKGSYSPTYKTANLAGTITSGGLGLSVQLVSD